MREGDICEIFSGCFEISHKTIVVGGATEPLYEPACSESGLARIYFREDYASSALHEIAHWCIAGQDRRKLVDYGYWYEPDRGVEAQQRFEEMEVKPQSLEWIFTEAAGLIFQVSVDNFDEATVDRARFGRAVSEAAINRLESGLNKRARQFVDALIAASGSNCALSVDTYRRIPV